jgi:hypothetical protein
MSESLNPKSQAAFSHLATLASFGLSPLAEMERRRFEKIERLRASGVQVWVLDDQSPPIGVSGSGRTCSQCGARFWNGMDYCSADCCRAGREAEKRKIADERAAMKAANAKSKAKKRG